MPHTLLKSHHDGRNLVFYLQHYLTQQILWSFHLVENTTLWEMIKTNRPKHQLRHSIQLTGSNDWNFNWWNLRPTLDHIFYCVSIYKHCSTRRTMIYMIKHTHTHTCAKGHGGHIINLTMTFFCWNSFVTPGAALRGERFCFQCESYNIFNH